MKIFMVALYTCRNQQNSAVRLKQEHPPTHIMCYQKAGWKRFMDTFNAFDLAVIGILIVAVVLGFRSGLLRSLATILGYVCAAPVAIAGTPMAVRLLTEQLRIAPLQEWLVFAGLFLVTGIVLAALMRLAVSEMTGQQIGVGDRTAGAMLAAVRIVLLAVVLVLIFDRVIPDGREPAFLAGSKLRPILSAAGRQGLQSLPPNVTDAIDRLKRERGI
jgi:membrane protein required for colicin V production